MLDELVAMAERAAEMDRGYEPATVPGDRAEAIADAARRVIRAMGSIEARSDARAAEANAWRRAGAKSAEEWLARKSGTSKARAKKKLKLGGQLDRHEQLRDRYASGHVSEDQAEIVGGAADENPNAEADLLNAAEDESLATLRQRAARAKAEVSDEEERQAKIHEERYASAGSDEEGAYRGSFRMSAFQGGIFDTIWQRFRDHIAKDVKKRGLKLNAGQIGADALVLMAQTAAEVDTGGSGPGLSLPDVSMHILIDEAAKDRGYTKAGETCEIDGEAGAERLPSVSIRPGSPRSDAHAFAGQWHRGCWLELREQLTSSPERVASRARPNAHTSSPGRAHIPAVLDTAIRIRDRVCAHPGCDRCHRLQRDHKVAVGLGGRTTYHQLQRLCWGHHDDKTRDDMQKMRASRHARAGPAP